MATTMLKRTWAEAKWWVGYFVIGTAVEVLLTALLFWIGGVL